MRTQVAVDIPSLLAQQRVRRWQRAYAKRLIATDLIAVVVAVYGAQLVRFGVGGAELEVLARDEPLVVLNYTLFSALLGIAWMAMLSYFGTRDYKLVGNGSAEYKRITDATIRLFGVLAIIAFLAQLQIARMYLLIAFPAGLFLLLLSRWVWRKWLINARATGAYSHLAVVMGDRGKSEHVARQMARAEGTGIRIVGATTIDGRKSDELIPGVPVLGELGDTIPVLDRCEADTLILTGADVITPLEMRRIGWALEARGVNLVVAPALTDVAGPRIHATPVAGLPLIYVDYPEFEGRKYVTKRAFDVVISSALILLLSPLFLVLTILVRRDSPGSAFFGQERVGLRGRHFRMFKFRSMVQDAEDLLPSLLDASDGNGVLFKMKADPRVTKVGAVLRRYSLDELPQLLNVLRGDMSLVGPRPPLPAEVARYEQWVHRRLQVKPGITGLWQTEGRSSLSWDDSVRLDLYYVENWSITGDVIILYRTARAVVRPAGAY